MPDQKVVKFVGDVEGSLEHGQKESKSMKAMFTAINLESSSNKGGGNE